MKKNCSKCNYKIFKYFGLVLLLLSLLFSILILTNLNYKYR